MVSSTHSHLTTVTKAKRENWQKFKIACPIGAEPAYLVDVKGMLPRVAVGAIVARETEEFVFFKHQPCPKLRVAVPLQRPWLAADYPSQDVANAVWRERIEALAAALGLQHDQACTDTSRLFYLPRRPADGPPAETCIIEGAPCDIFALTWAAGGAFDADLGFDTASDSKGRGGASQAGDSRDYIDPDTGEVFNLRNWVRQHGNRFKIVEAIRARRPLALKGRVADSVKVHIRCPNESAHTEPGADGATFAIDATLGSNKGFVIHCRHAHCTGQDRLFFVRKMLEDGSLKVEDLIASEFLTIADDGAPRESPPDPGGAASEPDNTARANRRSADDAADDGPITEGSVAAGFARLLNDRLRYCHHVGAWYWWNGVIWQKEETKLAYRWAHQLARRLAKDSENFKAILQAGKASFAAGVERIAQSDRVFAVTSGVWDTDPLLLGTPAGTVDLRTGELRTARQADMIAKSTAVPPAATAECPQFRAFLNQAAAGEEALVGFLKRWFGYCLTGETREHALLFVCGPGGNGKGVFLGTVADILGSYAATAAMDTFTVSKSDRHDHRPRHAPGARLVITTETEEDRAWAEARIKALTGGDPITARFMRRDFFTFKPAFKLTISGNHKPRLRNVDDAARRRFNIAPFRHKPAAPDKMLTENLKDEWPGILRWLIDGCLEWQRDGLNPPKVVLDSTSEYFAEQDIIVQWLDECCDKGHERRRHELESVRIVASPRRIAAERMCGPRRGSGRCSKCRGSGATKTANYSAAEGSAAFEPSGIESSTAGRIERVHACAPTPATLVTLSCINGHACVHARMWRTITAGVARVATSAVRILANPTVGVVAQWRTSNGIEG